MADLFDIVVARKLSGGGGGGTTVEALSVTQNGTYTAPSGKAYSPVTVNVSGGSSDFSTATVVITDNTEYVEHNFGGLFNISAGDLESGVQIYGGNQRTVTAVLYHNYLSAYIETSDNITATGDIEVEADSGWVDLYISGDGTITIS